MKVRDSGMPEEQYWESLFDVRGIVEWMALGTFQDVAELGCGYGTFTIPVARVIAGTVYTFDVDPVMLARTRERALGLPISCQQRDVLAEGFGVHADCVLLFNILHGETPIEVLQHAAKTVRRDGQVIVIHWQHRETPRGPSLEIRPKPEQILEWAEHAGLAPIGGIAHLPPWHYGIKFQLAERDDAGA